MQETRLLAWQPLSKILLPSTRSRLLRLKASPSYFHIPGAWVLRKDPLHTLYDPSHNALCFLFSARQWHLRTRQIEDIRTLETMAGGLITNSSPFVDSTFTWPVAGPGEGPGGLAPPLFLDKTDARRAEKNFFGDRSPAYLRV